MWSRRATILPAESRPRVAGEAGPREGKRHVEDEHPETAATGLEAAPRSGELLRRYRLAAGLTQEALAERSGLSARSIQHLERGETRPYRDTLQRLVKALG